MIGLGGVWLLSGCLADRVEALEMSIAVLTDEVDRLNAEAGELEGQLGSEPPPTASKRVDNDPVGFDATRPLPEGHRSRPDVILLSIDTLRADHLGTYGYERDTSPFIDRLANEGVAFESAWSPTSWTLPSHTTMLSGQLPVHHGAIEDHLLIPDDVPLVQTTFRRGGYKTFGGVATMFVSSRYGFSRDFDHFEDFGIRSKQQNNLSTVDADHVFNHALHWAQDQPDGKPMFLFLHVYDVHYNYDAPAPWNEKFDRAPEWGDERYNNYHAYKKRMISAVQLEHQVAQYDEEIAFVDDAFRQLVETWRAADRDLIVMVTADHGEEFGERGSWGHAHTLWPEQLWVPLVVNGPGISPARIPDRIGTEDIAPTLASLAGLSFRGQDGENRAPQIRTGAAAPMDTEAARFADTSRFDSVVLRWHEWPFDLHVDLPHKQRLLCKLDEDPTCTRNQYRDHLEQGEAMFGRMMTWLEQPWSARQDVGVEVHDGYIFVDGDRRNQNLEVSTGDRFAVLPADAKILVHTAKGDLGPWQPLGGTIPGAGCPLGYDGRYTVGNELVIADDSARQAHREQLKALGYLQDDEEEEPPQAGPSGPVPCP